MRFILYAVFVLFTLLCIIIAVSNNDTIAFSLNPLPINIDMPAFMLVFLGLIIGLVGGWAVNIASGLKHTRRHRLADKKINELQKKLDELEAQTTSPSNNK